MFMLESHLSADQYRVVGEMRQLADDAGVNVFLTGGAIRDMLGGFPVRGLDFTAEGSAVKLAKADEKAFGAAMVSTDDHRKSVEMSFPDGVTVEPAMARQEKFAKSGAKPQISAATIHDDLRTRDFTINAIGLSLNKASLGLLIDPTNGVGDIERKELRAIHNYSFYDEPARMLRLIRFKVPLGLRHRRTHQAAVRKCARSGNADQADAEALLLELRGMANEVNIHDLVQALAAEKLMGCIRRCCRRKAQPAGAFEIAEIPPDPTVGLGPAHERAFSSAKRSSGEASSQGSGAGV